MRPFNRTSFLSKSLRAMAVLGALSGASAPAFAQQNLFAPVALVNDSVVTRYELNQRLLLNKFLGRTDSYNETLDTLVNERLQGDTTKRYNITADDEAIAKAIESFASRGKLSPQRFINLLAKEGIAAETFRDYIKTSIAWRNYVQARFNTRAVISEADIDRELSQNSPNGGLRVLLSELFLPARNPEETAKSEALAKQIQSKPSIAAFAGAAREYSVAPSGKKDGGKREWIATGDLPPPVRSAISGLRAGEITKPLSTGNAMAIFQLRAVAEIDRPTPNANAIKYAAYYINGGHSDEAMSRAAYVKSMVNTCSDLYGIAKGEAETSLDIGTVSVRDIPNDVALELSKLDNGETSTALTRSNGQTLVFLMLCNREYDAVSASVDRDQIKAGLRNKRLTEMANSHLAELRADASIVLK